MSNFRNIQNNGIWQPGGTYTFEVYEPTYSEIMPFNWVHSWGNLLVASNMQWLGDEGACLDINNVIPANYLFDNNNSNFEGSVDETPLLIAELCEDEFWTKYTITLPAELPSGNYYFKRTSYDCWQQFE